MSLPPPTPPYGSPSVPPYGAVPPPPSGGEPVTTAPARRRRSTGWIVGSALLAVALIAALVGLAVTRRDLNDARRQRDGQAARIDQLQQQVQRLQPSTTTPGGQGGQDGGQDQSPLSGLQDLLKGLLGGNGSGDGSSNPLDALKGLLGGALGGDGQSGGLGGTLGGVDPKCVAGDSGLAGILGGLGSGNKITGTPQEQVAKIADLVEQERGLTFTKRPEPLFLPASEFDAKVAANVDKEYPKDVADLDGRLLGLLGAIPKGTDLLALQRDLLSGQVAGYYDPDSGEVVVRMPENGQGLDANAQITLAHELDHALTDQALKLPDTSKQGDSDGNLAKLALVEGDATLLMQRFALAHVPLTDQLKEAMSPELGAAQQDLAKQPYYLQQQLLYPYTDGLAYACRLNGNGGWKGVDAAYKAQPKTTAEVLFAGRDGQDAADAPAPREPGGSWKVARHDTLGAASLLWLWSAPGGDTAKAVSDAKTTVEGWRGDKVLLATDGDRSAVGLSFTTDGSAAFCKAMDTWYGAAFPGSRNATGNTVTFSGDGQDAVLRCDGTHVAVGIAPDATTAAALLPA